MVNPLISLQRQGSGCPGSQRDVKNKKVLQHTRRQPKFVLCKLAKPRRFSSLPLEISCLCSCSRELDYHILLEKHSVESSCWFKHWVLVLISIANVYVVLLLDDGDETLVALEMNRDHKESLGASQLSKGKMWTGLQHLSVNWISDQHTCSNSDDNGLAR